MMLPLSWRPAGAFKALPQPKNMKTTRIVIALVAIAITGMALHSLLKGTEVTYTAPETVVVTPAPLTSEQQAWLGALEWCESGGNPKAINPKDSDGTPSYGILQFKPGTFRTFAGIYGLSTSTSYMNRDEQVAIVTQMVVRNGVNWHQQFPACVARLGLPPLSPAVRVRS